MPKTNTPSEPEAVESDLPADTLPGEPIPEPDAAPPAFDPATARSALDNPAHPLHHLRNA